MVSVDECFPNRRSFQQKVFTGMVDAKYTIDSSIALQMSK